MNSIMRARNIKRLFSQYNKPRLLPSSNGRSQQFNCPRMEARKLQCNQEVVQLSQISLNIGTT